MIPNDSLMLFLEHSIVLLNSMFLRVNRAFFARNRIREKDFGDIFNKTSKGITNIMPLIITIFFAPVLITTSLFSKEIILILANLSLSLGYVGNFIYRLYQNEVSKAELLITVLSLAALLALAYVLFPPLGTLSFISFLCAVNQVAVTVNLFFLIKVVIIPPCKKFIENVAQWLGFDIATHYYSKPPLTLEKDRYIIDQLLKKSYDHDSYSADFSQEELARLNRLLTKLSRYIDKYDESVLGYIYNRDAIADLEQQIAQLTTQGNPDSSYTFIQKKIGFKTTKIQMLQEAEKKVLTALEDTAFDATSTLQFFKGAEISEMEKSRDEVLHSGLECLQSEIQRQKSKIDSLEACLPRTVLH
jgi:hypothetical protein